MPPKDSESKDPVDLSASSGNDKNANKSGKDKKKKSAWAKDDGGIPSDSLSEEDKELKDRLETCVVTVSAVPAVVPAAAAAAADDTKAPVAVAPPPSMSARWNALQIMVTELRTATSSMTSVPKPLKFLRPHYTTLKQTHAKLLQAAQPSSAEEEEQYSYWMLRARLADVLSVLAMTVTATTAEEQQPRQSLFFKLIAVKDHLKVQELVQAKAMATEEEEETKDDNLGSWGHEYVRSLAGEIGQEYNARVVGGADPSSDQEVEDLLSMVKVIVPFHISHNAEAEAVDLLIEVQRLSYLLALKKDFFNQVNSQRICLYLVKTADYMADPDDYIEMLETAYEIYRKQGHWFDAMRVGLRMGRWETCVPQLLQECHDKIHRRQMCLLLGRHGVPYTVPDDFVFSTTPATTATTAGETSKEEEEQVEEMNDEMEIAVLNELIGNTLLHEQFTKLAQDLDVVDAKTPQDIYKSHLAETGGFSRGSARPAGGGPPVDSARANLASTLVNALVNAGFGHDKLMTVSNTTASEGEGDAGTNTTTNNNNEWLYKNKDHGMLSAAASLGSILLWNVEEGLTQIDKYLYSSDDYVKAGATLAVGIVSCGVRNDADPALALLTEHVEGEDTPHIIKCAACTGLGIAYAGTARDDVMTVLMPMVENTGGMLSQTMVQVSLAGLALGMIGVGSCHEGVGGTLVQRLMEATDDELNHSHVKYLCLGLALLFLGQAEKAEAMMEAVRTIEHSVSRYAVTLLETCAYAGTGNVLLVQKMLHECAEHLTDKADHQMAAVIGIALITLGEDVGSEMALRSFDHLLHYCELPIKRAVPLALATLHISNPEFSIIDQLSRLSHDPDPELSQNAILGLGITSAGTNNSRVAGLLRQLSEFYAKDANHVFCVRISQGLLHLGKGLLTLNPLHSDRLLCKPAALAGMLVLLQSCLDLKNTILDKSHYLLYYLTTAMHPRMLITIQGGGEDAESCLEWRPVTVRVGQAVDTVGQAGKPRRITGFQTHQSPVLLSATDRAELGTEEVVAVAGTILEGLVIVQDNPEYETVAATTSTTNKASIETN